MPVTAMPDSMPDGGHVPAMETVAGILERAAEIAFLPFALVLGAFIAPGASPWWAWVGVALIAAGPFVLLWILARLAWRLARRIARACAGRVRAREERQ